MEHIKELVKARRSVRTYDGRALTAEDRNKLMTYARAIENPYGLKVDFKLLEGEQHGLKCPVITGTDLYIGGKINRDPHAFEAFGYSFEMLVLYAQSIGIGTVWLGGTMNRSAFEDAMELAEGEMMPCASPLGYTAPKMSLREGVMRKGVGADQRLAFGELFFDGNFDTPLSEEKAGALAFPLEMVRWAPSAVNKQPWRVLVTDKAVHFYLKRSKGFSPHGTLDMQRIDMGIGLCHFDLATKECGMTTRLITEDPGLGAGTDMEYIATFVMGH